MTKPEWGNKRTCLNCGTRFYDMQRTPIICPKCGSENAPDAVSKVRRGIKKTSAAVAVAAAAAAAAEAKAKAAARPADDETLDDVDVEVEDDDVDDALMEDASDLAEDDDMSEMMDHLAPGEED